MVSACTPVSPVSTASVRAVAAARSSPDDLGHGVVTAEAYIRRAILDCGGHLFLALLQNLLQQPRVFRNLVPVEERRPRWSSPVFVTVPAKKFAEAFFVVVIIVVVAAKRAGAQFIPPPTPVGRLPVETPVGRISVGEGGSVFFCALAAAI